MSEVLLVAGLPGCGKTTLRADLERQGYIVFDDFKACAHDNSSRFWKSRHYNRLLQLLRDGTPCAVADIDFCHADAQTEAESTLREQVPSVSVGWRFFANDPDACEANIRHRNREQAPQGPPQDAEVQCGLLDPRGRHHPPGSEGRCIIEERPIIEG